MIYRSGLKRGLDVTLGLIGVSLFVLPILVATAAVKVSSPGPALFVQTRVGKNGKSFQIYKLRTMEVDPHRSGTVQVDQNDPKIFAVGRFLRRFKIDEIPQLLNVIKGEMSFVGPRPCLEATRNEMPEWSLRRFEVRPGLTGLAQTRGNVSLSWEKRWEQDIEYVESMSFILDIRLLLKTVLVILFGEDRFRGTA